ncbi:integrase core domain-containing protein [Pleionea sp. CnH1-48]|uniref:integrase core domain-containing protein n=1 Tax=Pleionea sp. CnH1-48 TaxID=2954494 RepID=UPI002097ED07|nr:integrase core domain-containing protein [Pleionea sp. CnH1-48]MCO7227589.1 integrase core domain-containing protein [Pleionea sp. CnH1-48]
MLLVLSLLFIALISMFSLYYYLKGETNHRPFTAFKKPIVTQPEKSVYRKNRKKPEWVVNEVIRLVALMSSQSGCRKLADLFNELHGSKETVSKTYVYNLRNKHAYDIQALKRNLKHKRPKPVPKNTTWAMDLTYITTVDQKQQIILAIIEHATRACLKLEVLDNKSSTRILLSLIQTIKQFGFPKNIRTDNEINFCSRLMTTAFTLLNIKHQRTKVAAPWQNGKVERFFGTLKSKTRTLLFDNQNHLNNELNTFRFWYNHVRTHDYLDGKTPTQCWDSTKHSNREKAQWFDKWRGLLRGYYIPRE